MSDVKASELSAEELAELQSAIDKASPRPVDFEPSLTTKDNNSWEIGIVGNGGLIDWKQEIAMIVSTEADAAAFVLLWNAAQKLIDAATRLSAAEDKLRKVREICEQSDTESFIARLGLSQKILKVLGGAK